LDDPIRSEIGNDDLKFWLFKSEPDSYSIDDLAKAGNQTASWEGVRNYRARNILRDEVKVGDGVFFHHSSTDPPGIVGICRIVNSGYPDPSAFDRQSPYFDSKSTKENPRWFTVDVKLVRKLKEMITLTQLKETPGLERMMVCQRGARLSVQPVTADEWSIITHLADKQR